MKPMIDENGNVLLTVFTGTDMEKDSKVVESFYRVKKYVQPRQMLTHHRYRDFNEPYQVARDKLGGTLNDYNDVFTIQLPYCNLNCLGCYVGKDLMNDVTRMKYIDPEEIVDAYGKAFPSGRGVVRISGGEPFLTTSHATALGLIITGFENRGMRPHFWVDTNLLGVYGHGNLWMDGQDVGISACFKGLTFEHFNYMTGGNETAYEKQWKNAKVLLDACKLMEFDLFFVVPEIVKPVSVFQALKDVDAFCTRLRDEIHKNAPLRTSVLTWKTYATNEAEMPRNRFHGEYTRTMFLNWLVSQYGVEQVWLPQHQISVKS